MSDYERFNDLFQAADEASASSRGKYWTQLTIQDQKLIQEFLADMTGFTQNSRNSYKSYLAKAIVEPATISRDQRSALKKFRSWLESQ